jgi:hypothetical protein
VPRTFAVRTHDVVDVLGSLGASQGQIEDALDVVILEGVAQGDLVLGQLNLVHLDLVLGGRLQELLHVVASREELVSKGRKMVNNNRQPVPVGLASEQNTFAGKRRAAGASR